MYTRLCSVLGVGAVGLATALAPGAQARPQTTTPGIIYVIKTTVTDTRVLLARDRFNTPRLTAHGTYRYPRGAQLRFAITNRGTRPYALKMWETTSRVMKPRGRDAIFINWLFRGTYRYVVLYRGKPVGPKGSIIIF
jgi:hypothetical protein